METYDTGIACKNGHEINASATDYPQFNAAFCGKCGAPAIDECLECHAKLRGSYRGGVVTVQRWKPARFCHSCGAAYPWTREALSTARLLADEDEKLSDDDRQVLQMSLDDLTKDGPAATLAATRFKRVIAKAGASTASGIKEVMVNVLSEAAKKSIWG